MVEDVAGFVAWLRLPPAARGAAAAVLSVAEHCAASTINRKLAAVGSMYEHALRCGVPVAASLRVWRPAGRRAGARSFLHHVSKSRLVTAPVVWVRAGRRMPRTLSGQEVAALVASCGRGRDRLLVQVLAVTGMRVGEALGLRHEDWDVAECQVRVVGRENENRARSKSLVPRTIPVPASLVRAYADYLHGEYGELDSDYVFVSLWGGRVGAPLTYAAVFDMVRRLRARTGIDVDPHWLRHTYATDLLRAEVPVEVVSALLGHASVTTTSSTYAHLSVTDTRASLVCAGVLPKERTS